VPKTNAVPCALPLNDPQLDFRQAALYTAEVLGCAPLTAARLIRKQGPAPCVAFSRKLRRYRLSELTAWLAGSAAE
jgi:hypothetical protein